MLTPSSDLPLAYAMHLNYIDMLQNAEAAPEIQDLDEDDVWYSLTSEERQAAYVARALSELALLQAASARKTRRHVVRPIRHHGGKTRSGRKQRRNHTRKRSKHLKTGR